MGVEKENDDDEETTWCDLSVILLAADSCVLGFPYIRKQKAGGEMSSAP